MIKKLLPLLILFVSVSHSQTFEWVKTPISATTFSSKGYCSAIDPSGNVYMAGFKDTQVSYTETFGNLLLQKYNSSGDLLLDTTFTGTGVVHQLMTDSSGNVLVAIEHLNALEVDGVTIPNPTVFPQHVFLKLSPTGDLLWHKVMNITDSHVQTFMSIVVDASDNIYLGYDDFNGCYIEKVDPNGNLLTMITQTNVNRITSLAVDTEGNIYAAGSCANTNSIFAGVLQPTDFAYTVYLVKYSPTGVFQWLNYVEDITCATPIVKAHTPNDIYFCAETFLSVQLGAITLNGSFSGVNFFLTKLNASGEYLWAREAPATGNVEVGTRNYLSLDALGNVYIAGVISGGLADWGNDITTDTHTFSNREALLLQYDSSGEIQQAVTAGGLQNDEANSVVIGQDGAIYLTGIVRGTATFGTITHSEDDPFAYTPFMAKLLNTPLSVPQNELADLRVYPNPVTNLLTVLTLQTIVDVKVFSLNGQRMQLPQNGNQLDFSGVTNGVYVVEVLTENGLERVKVVR